MSTDADLIRILPLEHADGDLVDFVETVLMDKLTGAGKQNQKKWCADWEQHPEAVHRLQAIYDVWQETAIGQVGLHGFYHDVLDYHLPLPTSPETGVFAQCDRDGHQPHSRIDKQAKSSDTTSNS
jgi:hypothetical protein